MGVGGVVVVVIVAVAAEHKGQYNYLAIGHEKARAQAGRQEHKPNINFDNASKGSLSYKSEPNLPRPSPPPKHHNHQHHWRLPPPPLPLNSSPVMVMKALTQLLSSDHHHHQHKHLTKYIAPTTIKTYLRWNKTHTKIDESEVGKHKKYRHFSWLSKKGTQHHSL